ncbi:uncharacterized protein V1516DRAFT_695534 [Lipomyces oligophaga]|uniref:uncharacterized protein n=1 Tax=Lipomyces oligophaga TaxID=45792 RepID=UPI0034CDF76C
MLHHHRSSLKHKNKSFKTKHLSKSALKAQTKGKVEKSESGQRHGREQSKQERKNRAKQLMLSKKEEHVASRKIFAGKKGAPRIIAIVSLCPDVDSAKIVRRLNESVGSSADLSEFGSYVMAIDRFQQKLQYLVVPRHLSSILNAAEVADFVVFGLSAKQEVDKLGETCLRSIIAQGVSNIYAIVDRLQEVESLKSQTEIKRSLLSYVSHFFADQERIFSIDSRQDCLNIIRSLCQQFPKGIQWRDCRSYLLPSRLSYQDSTEIDDGYVLAEGFVRGKCLNPNRLIHIPGIGDFQLDRICSSNQSGEAMQGGISVQQEDYTGSFTLLPSDDQDSLDPFDEVEQDDIEMQLDYSNSNNQPRGVLLDEHFYIDEDENEDAPKSFLDKNHIPKGMSEYQARWIMEENSDDEFESGDEVEDEQMIGLDDMSMENAEYPASEIDAQSEMFVELSVEEEAKQFKQFQERERDDEEFPDEIELTPELSARKRLSRYRGLRSLRSSEWNVDESDPRAPHDWNKLSRFQNFRATRNRVMKEAEQVGVPAGESVILYIRAPKSVYLTMITRPINPIFSLLRYENKRVMLNATVTPNTEYEQPIPSKDSLILQYGPRRYRVNPIFSENGSSQNHIYKFERFLHQGHTALASMIVPVSFGNTPVLLFKETDRDIELVASGAVADADHSRIMVKRAVITGYPFKIHKRLVTVRYMFFNADDVAWFKAVPLFTKMGRQGVIKDSIGTHGYYKCTFNGPINAQDTIAMSLYKRVWPRNSTPWISTY